MVVFVTTNTICFEGALVPASSIRFSANFLPTKESDRGGGGGGKEEVCGGEKKTIKE